MHMWKARDTRTFTRHRISEYTDGADQSLLTLVSSVISCDSVARSMAAVSLANVAPKL